MKYAGRLSKVPPYLFVELGKKIAAVRASGADLIDLGVGDPDLPTPEYVVEALSEAARDPSTHRYPDYDGEMGFRTAVAEWYGERFGVKLDPRTEVMTLIGSKEGLAHILWAFVDRGDVALIPDPAYPVYKAHTLLCGGEPFFMDLTEENDFLPDLGRIPDEVARRATIMFLNYPSNPTSAVASREFFRDAVAFARRYDIALVHDAAYVEMTYDGYVAPSILEVPGARDVCVEFYSLSKPFNMTGWRIAAAVGNTDILFKGLGVIKSNTDSGQFNAVQRAATVALRHNPRAFIAKMNSIYVARRDVLVDGLLSAGFRVMKPSGTFYLWVKTPDGLTSTEFASMLLEKAHVVVTPGEGYGRSGAGYVRMALTVDEDRLREVVRRISALGAETGPASRA